jgi:hypothetical protein
MRSHKTRRRAAFVNIPGAANIQDRPIRSREHSVHDKARPVFSFLAFHHIVFTSMLLQCLRQAPPLVRSEAKMKEK